MAREPVFYSFHFDNDVFRVQQVRNMGVIEENSPVSPNDWEEIRRKGEASIQKWIDANVAYRRCVVVLVGSNTANRKWVKYEIKKAYDSGKGLFGIYIHNLNCPRNGRCRQGPNPFDSFTINNGRQQLSSVIQVLRARIRGIQEHCCQHEGMGRYRNRTGEDSLRSKMQEQNGLRRRPVKSGRKSRWHC